MSAATIAIIITVLAIIMYATEVVPIAVTSIFACLAMAVFGVISYKDAFAGFSNDTTMMVLGMIVIGNALFETGAASLIGSKLVKAVGTNEKKFLAAVILVAGILSGFLSNTGVCAMFLPVIASVAATSGGLITKKNTYMALGFATVAGGMLTLVGSTPQLVAQGILQKMGQPTMGFFTIGVAGIPLLILLLVYFMTFGYSFQKKVFDFAEKQDTQTAEAAAAATVEKPVNPVKMWISILVLATCVAGFITKIWTVGMIAMVGALVCVLTGCISEKRVYQTMDWTTVAVLAGALGFADGLDKSGAGKIIADSAVRLLGTDATPWVVFAAIVLIATVLTNIMSNTACTAMLTPICIFMAQGLGINPLTLVVGLVIGANLSYSTPIATPPVTMTLVAGYRFMDYVKVGGLFNILAYIVTIIVVPLFLPLR